MYFGEIENFAYGKINERSFRNPHPCAVASQRDRNQGLWFFAKQAAELSVISDAMALTYCGLVTPYSGIDMGQ